jgi:hypothetical protein
MLSTGRISDEVRDCQAFIVDSAVGFKEGE